MVSSTTLSAAQTEQPGIRPRQTRPGKTQTAPGKNFDTDKNGLFPRQMPGKQAHNILLSGMAPHETKPKPKPYFTL
ncbi:hypothetical protein [Mobiluncus mulieris]|uniref:hypothetical protein n=1 Tax=Mobiluncus mulieris TaxID=2052 RepID=UPI001470480E|nr:hypothetical protein [Mobiluncus mulieris]NMX12517.1 hypothetical protein [Mobiluncus mulieris]